MELVIILLILFISFLLIAMGLAQRSFYFIFAGSILLMISGVLILSDGIDIQSGESSTYSFSLNNSANTINGTVSNLATISYKKISNDFTRGLAISFGVISLILIALLYTDRVKG